MVEDGVYNAVFEGVDLIENGCLTLLYADLRIGKSLQVRYGPVCIGNRDGPWAGGVTLISKLMEVADVDSWSKIRGKPCRVVMKDGWAVRLMHFLIDEIVCDAENIRREME